MEKFDSGLCQRMNCAIYQLFQFSYLHTFYKPNNIKTKPSIKVILKLIFKFSTINTLLVQYPFIRC